MKLMFLAGHYPTKRFAAAELAAMPMWRRGSNELAPCGWNRGSDDIGKPLAFYVPFNPVWIEGPDCTLKRVALDKQPHCVVRPVVRVSMGRQAA